MKLLSSALQNICFGTEWKKALSNYQTIKRRNKKRQHERMMNMKKLLFVLMAACCVWAAYDYTRPVDRYVVKVTAADGDTLWHLVGDVMDREGDRRDIHEVIFYTRQISNIKGMLQPGDVLLIPIEVRR